MQAATLKPSRTAPSSKAVHATETYTAALPATGYVRLPIASAVCSVAKSTIWAWAAQGRFPKPVKLSPRVSAWPVADVRAWVADPAAWQAANAPAMEG
ncbi:helix-turn-helix transcriptional regulator [Bordetella trematum]|uniref:helix-turn-helix transcriptional regulator n=1 Tax=Bordetella trematum TaxID=123899 RepID=UPI0009DEB4E9|nr:AlpA family phage regulatory protein [Bordetella trematum]